MSEEIEVIERLRKISQYFKSMLKVGYKGDSDIYLMHRETINMAIELLAKQNPSSPIKADSDELKETD